LNVQSRELSDWFRAALYAFVGQGALASRCKLLLFHVLAAESNCSNVVVLESEVEGDVRCYD